MEYKSLCGLTLWASVNSSTIPDIHAKLVFTVRLEITDGVAGVGEWFFPFQ